MFRERDKQEELNRLQHALLEEEAQTEVPPEADYLDEGVVDTLLGEDTKAGNAGVYQNYSNGYGKNLRNYASGYKAYNSDKTDTDLETYSEAVREPQKRSAFMWFLLILMFLLCASGVALVVYYLRLGGIL